MTKKIIFKFIMALMVVVCAASFIGCLGKNKETETNKSTVEKKDDSSDKITIVDFGEDWGFPSPYQHNLRGPGYFKMSFIFDTLIWKNEKGFIPAIAEKWEYIKGENAYLFQIKDHVKWHDGEKLTVEDIIFTLDYAKKNSYPWANTDFIDKTEKIDQNKVKVYLNKPYGAFLANVAGTLPILPEHIYKNVDTPDEFNKKEALIGCGPYKLIKYNIENKSYLYKAFDDYYGGKSKFSRISFVNVKEDEALELLESKKVDASIIPGDKVEKVKSEGFNIIESKNQWATKLMFNHKKQPLDNKLFRKAIAYGINRKEVIDLAQDGYAEIGNPGFFPKNSKWYSKDVEQYNYNVAETKKIIEGLGYKLKGKYYEKDGKQLVLNILSSHFYEKDVDVIEKQLEKIGINTIKTIDDRAKIGEDLDSGNFDIAILGQGVIGDPEVLNMDIIKDNSISDRFNSNKELVELLNKQLITTSEKDRKSILAKAEKIYADEIPSLILYYPTLYWAYNDKVKLYFSENGLAMGIPNPLNKINLIENNVKGDTKQ